MAEILNETDQLIEDFRQEERHLVGSLMDSSRRRVERGWQDRAVIGIGNAEGNITMPVPTSGRHSGTFETDQFYPVLKEKYGFVMGSFVVEGRPVWVGTAMEQLRRGDGVNRRHHYAEAYFPLYAPDSKKPIALKLEKPFNGTEVWSVVEHDWYEFRKRRANG